MPPEHFQPKDDERGAEDCRSEDDAKLDERLIPARWKRCQLPFHKIQLVHDLSEVVAGLGSLAEGEALGI